MLRIGDFPFWLVLELGHPILVEEEPILVSSSLWFWLSLLKEGKKRRKQVGSVKKLRLGNYPNFLSFCFCFCWFELGLKLALILFWFRLELSFDKDQKLYKETCRCFRGSVVQIYLKPVFLCWS